MLKRIVEFTDPSDSLVATRFSLNQCVLVDAQEVAPVSWKCPDSFQGIHADLHDGDQKEVTVSPGAISMKPSGNDQTWHVDADFDTTYRNASINFSIPGKPSPAPASLTATLSGATSASPTGCSAKGVFEFPDPSGTLASPAFPCGGHQTESRDSSSADDPVDLHVFVLASLRDFSLDRQMM